VAGGVGGAVEAAGFVAVPADELERDQVDVVDPGARFKRSLEAGGSSRACKRIITIDAPGFAAPRHTPRRHTIAEVNRAVEVGIMGSGSVLRGAVFGKFLASRP
jgi:hypothetical protein